jgi:hypothetical protein
MKRPPVASLALCAVLAAALPAVPLPAAARDDDHDIAVEVCNNAGTVSVAVSFHVAVPPREAWDVLTDFDHMTGVVSNLETSRVVGTSGDKLLVLQKGKASRGPLSFAFENLREVELMPFEEISGRLVSGNLKAMHGTTRLAPEGDGTRVVNHGEFIPDVWIPPIVGVALIESETRKQFAEMRSEMLRRSRAAAATEPAHTGARAAAD